MAKRNRNRKGAASLPKSAVSIATAWDMGADGPANRRGLIVESAGDIDNETGEVINPNGIKRARRVDMLDVWQGKGEISKGQWNTAVTLRAAWEATQQAPGTDYARPRVDSSPKPDHAVAIAADRITILRNSWDRVHPDDHSFLKHVVALGGIPATYRPDGGLRIYHGRNYASGMQALRDALDRAGSQ